MCRKRARRASPFKRTIFTIGILLVLCVAAVSFLRDVDSESNRDVIPDNTVQPTAQSTMSRSPAMALPPLVTASEPTTDIQVESGRTSGILLVNAANPLPSDYRPENLVKLYEQKNKHFSLMKADIEVSKIVYDAMESMFEAAQGDGVRGFIITSGYRTRDEQRALYNSTTDGTAAKPGESEHETGLAFDVGVHGDGAFETTPQYEWLSQHCAEFGFIIRYPKGMEDVTGYPFEPWHYRYVGKEIAKIIMDKGITLEQYCKEYQ